MNLRLVRPCLKNKQSKSKPNQTKTEIKFFLYKQISQGDCYSYKKVTDIVADLWSTLVFVRYLFLLMEWHGEKGAALAVGHVCTITQIKYMAMV